MKKTSLILMLAIMFLISSCATLFTGSQQTVQINSLPSGAKIQVNGVDRGTTPTAIKLKKGNEGQVLTLKVDGYETKTFQPETAFNGVSILNLFNVLCWGIDAATGALWKYDPKFYEIELTPKKVENK
jgi:hypothetical protein